MSTVIRTLRLEAPVLGQQIVDVLKELAGEGHYVYRSEHVLDVDGKDYHVVGCSSKMAYEHFCVLTDDLPNENTLDVSKQYDPGSLRVASTSWGSRMGHCDTVVMGSLGSHPDAKREAIEKTRDLLEKRLNEYVAR